MLPKLNNKGVAHKVAPFPFVVRGKTSNMTQSQLIAKLATRYPQLLAKDVEVAVNAIFSAITSNLVSAQRIEIRGFRSFGLNYRPPRTGRNPKMGEKVSVPEKFVPHFQGRKGTALSGQS
jgi:integration host factor subunit beta